MDGSDRVLDLLGGLTPDERANYLYWRGQVHGTNISERTLLATDYLNHFNEIVMLLEMVPDMPDMLDDCLQWQPRSYVEHFQASGFSDKEIAIAAYSHVPSRYRLPLETLVLQLEIYISATLFNLTLHRHDLETPEMRLSISDSVRAIQKMVMALNSIIHGSDSTMDQEEIDLLLRIA